MGDKRVESQGLSYNTSAAIPFLEKNSFQFMLLLDDAQRNPLVAAAAMSPAVCESTLGH